MKNFIKKVIPWRNYEEKIYKLYKKANSNHKKNREHIVDYYNYKIQRKYNCVISGRANIASKIYMPHPIGIVIGRDVIIGHNVTIYQNVTIGQKNDKFPQIGNDVTIYAGAVIIGDIKVGNNVIIGANSVVTKDIPDNCVVAGVPAKVIKKTEA